jgi:pathogenesis-related protein 1
MVDLGRARVDPLTMQTRWGLLAITCAACSGETDGVVNGDANNMMMGDGSMMMIDARPGVGEPAELMGITLYHNQVRAAVVTATPLPAMEWDANLAATAAAWIATCTDTTAPVGLIDHNPNRSQGHPWYVGENVFGSGGGASAQQAVTSWASEKANYNYDTNTCNGVCGHYTQIVWRTSIKLGCAKGTCAGFTYPTSIVCNYGPGGNSGGKPY